MKSFNFFRDKYFSAWHERLFFLLGVLMFVSEIWKQLTLTFYIGGGQYNWWYFPFQLCSIPMYVLLAYPWLQKRSVRQTLLVFLMCYTLLGGIAVFADTSGLHYPYFPLTVHSYLWHILLIGIGLLAGWMFFRGFVRPGEPEVHTGSGSRRKAQSKPFPLLTHMLRPFAGSTGLYLVCCLIAEFLNLSLDHLGTINMFYINPDYQMQQVIFHDISLVTGNIPGILIYIAATMAGAFLLAALWSEIYRILLHNT